MSRRLTTAIEPHVPDYLALEYAASEPYNSFVFDDKAQADEIRHLLFFSGACEYSPPFGQLLLDESSPVGMIACLTGKQLTGIRLKGALELRRAGIVERYPGATTTPSTSGANFAEATGRGLLSQPHCDHSNPARSRHWEFSNESL